MCGHDIKDHFSFSLIYIFSEEGGFLESTKLNGVNAVLPYIKHSRFLPLKKRRRAWPKIRSKTEVMHNNIESIDDRFSGFLFLQLIWSSAIIQSPTYTVVRGKKGRNPIRIPASDLLVDQLRERGEVVQVHFFDFDHFFKAPSRFGKTKVACRLQSCHRR